MLLAIDAGNTNVVFAVYEQHRQLAQWRISTSHTRTADEYAVWLTHLMELAGIEPVDISAAIIASVVPAVTFNVERLARDHFNTEPLVIGRPEVDLGIKVLMDNPAEVGGDRLVDAVAARTRYRPPLIVIDFGTATTFNVVDSDGNYCGGAIAPGINLSVDALYQATALLPRIEVEKPPRVIGKSTVAAMKSGIYFGYVGLIEGMITRIQQEFGAKLRVIATGGLAPLFAEATDMIDETDGELTLLGLVDVYERNKAK